MRRLDNTDTRAAAQRGRLAGLGIRQLRALLEKTAPRSPCASKRQIRGMSALQSCCASSWHLTPCTGILGKEQCTAVPQTGCLLASWQPAQRQRRSAEPCTNATPLSHPDGDVPLWTLELYFSRVPLQAAYQSSAEQFAGPIVLVQFERNSA